MAPKPIAICLYIYMEKVLLLTVSGVHVICSFFNNKNGIIYAIRVYFSTSI